MQDDIHVEYKRVVHKASFFLSHPMAILKKPKKYLHFEKKIRPAISKGLFLHP